MCVYEDIHKILYDYFISFYYTIFIPAKYTGGGGDRDESTYSSLPLEGLQQVSILEFCSFKVNFEVERINFN
jgi:hypothetical protein